MEKITMRSGSSSSLPYSTQSAPSPTGCALEISLRSLFLSLFCCSSVETSSVLGHILNVLNQQQSSRVEITLGKISISFSRLSSLLTKFHPVIICNPIYIGMHWFYLPQWLMSWIQKFYFSAHPTNEQRPKHHHEGQEVFSTSLYPPCSAARSSQEEAGRGPRTYLQRDSRADKGC